MEGAEGMERRDQGVDETPCRTLERREQGVKEEGRASRERRGEESARCGGNLARFIRFIKRTCNQPKEVWYAPICAP